MSFKYNSKFEQIISGINKVHLSLNQYTPVSKKDLVGNKHTKESRKTPFEHLEQLAKQKKITDLNSPLMILSTRNVLANLRCIAYLKDYTKRPIAVFEEDDVIFKSRPYYVFGEKEGKLTIDTWDPLKWDNETNPFSWFISAVPVLWDDIDSDLLFQKIVAESADHSHVWYLPRGSHPDATDSSRKNWQDLQDIFLNNLTSSEESAFKKLNEYASEKNLIREENYFHNIIGLDSENNICQYISKGKLEDLGQNIKKLGAKRALCVDNSGSVTVQFLKKGIAGALTGESIQLIAAPNQRNRGTTYLVIELKDSKFN